MMNRPGFIRHHGTLVAHKGYYDRHGKHFLLPEDVEDQIVEEECGGCLVALYQMRLSRLTEIVLTPSGPITSPGGRRGRITSDC